MRGHPVGWGGRAHAAEQRVAHHDAVGLAGFSEQLRDLKLGELLDTPPPGIDEAIAIAKVVQFLKVCGG